MFKFGFAGDAADSDEGMGRFSGNIARGTPMRARCNLRLECTIDITTRENSN